MVGRSYREDPQGARERQMQQDIESAMSMCESFLSLVIVRFPHVLAVDFHLLGFSTEIW
jgi:uncharacterized protein YutE (UPF0331/DUF86 family)